MSYSAYEAYLSMNNSLASTPTNYFKEGLQAIVDTQFEYASNYYIVKHKDRINNTWSNIGVRLTKPFSIKNSDSLKDDHFQVIFKDADYVVYLGDMFEFEGYRWMVTDTSNINTVSNSVMIQRCNVQLKFVNSSTPVMPSYIGDYNIIDGIAEMKIRDMNEDKYFLLPTNQMMVKIPNDVNGKKIKSTQSAGTRFIFGTTPQAWRTISIDSISEIRKTYYDDAPDDYNGIINLRLQLDAINPTTDNTTLGLARQTI
jgi:hypothetical protein